MKSNRPNANLSLKYKQFGGDARLTRGWSEIDSRQGTIGLYSFKYIYIFLLIKCAECGVKVTVGSLIAHLEQSGFP